VTALRLSDQLCFPFYAIARGLQQRYRPLLGPLGLTYPQYLVMLVLWETDARSVGALAQHLHLDSATLTPLLKRVEAAGLVARTRDTADNRVVLISLTDAGRALRARAEDVPKRLVEGLGGREVDVHALKTMLEAVMRAVEAP
jgi:DNA-binding MarR family transcriptional regulator